MDYDVPKAPIERPKAVEPTKAKNLKLRVLSVTAPVGRPTTKSIYENIKDTSDIKPELQKFVSNKTIFPPGSATKAVLESIKTAEGIANKEKTGEHSAPVDKTATQARDKQPLARGKVGLESISDKLVADAARDLASDFPDIEARLMEYYNKIARPSVALPTVAPRLWASRPDDERDMNPAAFIRKVYKSWLGNGLTRAHIKKFDPLLYVSYAQWIRPERHSKDAITFAPRTAHNRIEDAEEAIKKRRNSSQKAKATRVIGLE